MKAFRHLVAAVFLLCSIGAAAQDSIDGDNSRYIDTAVTPLSEEVAEEEEDGTDLEGKVRGGSVTHSRWDSQVPGEWSDGAQTRLSIREVPASTMQQLRDMKALRYQSAQKPEGPNAASRLLTWILVHIKVFQYILFGLLGILLLAVIILFINQNDIPVFRWGRKARPDGALPPEAAGMMDYDAQAQAAIAMGNFREAVRLRYLQTLQLLENRELIAPGKDKTNMDYLRELAPTGWHKPFAHLTLHYEYVWYGKLPLSNGQFSQLDEKFAAFKNSLS